MNVSYYSLAMPHMELPLEIWLDILKQVSLYELSGLQTQSWLLRHAVHAELERRAKLTPLNENATIYLKVQEQAPQSFSGPFSFYRSDTTRLFRFRFKPEKLLQGSKYMYFGNPEEYTCDRDTGSFGWEKVPITSSLLEMFPEQLLALYWAFPDPEDGRYMGVHIYKAEDRSVFPSDDYFDVDVRGTHNRLRLSGFFCLETATLDETLMRAASNLQGLRFALQPVRQLAGLGLTLSHWSPFCRNCQKLLTPHCHNEVEIMADMDDRETLREDQFRLGKVPKEEIVALFSFLYKIPHPAC
jgi:hypothetical protein